MSSMVTYRSNSDHNVVCRDVWFRIKRNLGHFLVIFRSILTSSEVLKVPKFCKYISGSPEIVILSADPKYSAYPVPRRAGFSTADVVASDYTRLKCSQ